MAEKKKSSQKKEPNRRFVQGMFNPNERKNIYFKEDTYIRDEKFSPGTEPSQTERYVMTVYDEYRACYLKTKQAFIGWRFKHFSREGSGICRIGKYTMDPDRDWITDCSPDHYGTRRPDKNEKNSVPVTAVKYGLRHLPAAAEVELYFGNMPEEEREKYRKAFPDAKEITNA